MENERGDLIAESTDTEKITREYNEQLPADKFTNLVEVDKFTEGRNLPKLTQEEEIT